MTMSDDDQNRLNTLQTQQMYLTRALRAAAEGRWQGEDSVEAWLYAIDPSLQGQVQTNAPVYQ